MSGKTAFLKLYPQGKITISTEGRQWYAETVESCMRSATFIDCRFDRKGFIKSLGAAGIPARDIVDIMDKLWVCDDTYLSQVDRR
jgi:hypothetical protein